MKDKISNLSVRLGFNRMNYKVNPGLYAIGHPSENSDLVVTCNYKLTFDLVRNSLEGMNLWLLVLDTDGVNVWCAAGKGSFGSAELIYSLKHFEVEKYINHKNVIVPQLGAPGIQSHLVKEITTFNIKYGPVHIKDLEDYIKKGYQIDDSKRKVNFNLLDRLKVTSLEWVKSMKYFIVAMIALLIITVIIPAVTFSCSLNLIILYFLTVITGTILFPALLPYLPFRMFYKRALVLGSLVNAIFLISYQSYSLFSMANALISITLIGYLGLNFTGSTTFTSLSGVKKEMNEAVPILSIMAILGILMMATSLVLEVL